MRARNVRSVVVALLLALTALPELRAEESTIWPGTVESWSTQVDAVCATPSPDCDAWVDGHTEAALMFMRERHVEDVYPLARIATDSASASVRAAAALAFGAVVATAADTPYLCELLDDPVPMVREAALQSLRGSQDERGLLVVQRIDAFSTPVPREIEPDSPESAPAASAMGVPMPSDAVFLHFASDRGRGRYAWSTNEAPAKALARFTAGGKQALTAEAYRQRVEKDDAAKEAKQAELDKHADETDENGMPSQEALADAMAMAAQMMQGMNAAAEGSTDQERAEAGMRAAGLARTLDAGLADPYDKPELFGDPRFVVFETQGIQDVVAVVYKDLATGTTGISVHRPKPVE